MTPDVTVSNFRFVALQAVPIRGGQNLTTFTFRDTPKAKAADAARVWLECHGFSIGLAGDPQRKRAIVHGRFVIPGWSDLGASDLAGIDGRVVDGDGISVVEILPDADAEALAVALGREAA